MFLSIRKGCVYTTSKVNEVGEVSQSGIRKVVIPVAVKVREPGRVRVTITMKVTKVVGGEAV